MSESLPPAVHTALPRVWTSFAALICSVGLAILFQGIMGIVLAVVLLSQGVDAAQLGDKVMESMTNPGMFLLTLVLGQAAFAITTLAAARLSPEPMMQRVGLRGSPVPTKLYLLSMLGSIFVLAVAIGCVTLVSLVFTADGSVATLFDKMTPAWGVAFVVLIAVLPGFIEETLFRGYMQTRFLKRWNPLRAILLSSTLFALAHITPHAIAVALPLGIWFGYIAWRTNSIVPGIACHAFVNGGLNIWRLVAQFAELSENVQMICNGIFVVAGLVGFIAAIKMMANLPQPETETPQTGIETSGLATGEA